ncbi:hypothetical protein ACFLRI_04120 [Bacteroidota bacterium]
MDFKNLLFDSSKLVADYVVKQIGNDPKKFALLFDFVLENHPRYSARAAGVLYKLDDTYPELILPFLVPIIRNLSIQNTSILRAFLRILSRHVNQLNEEQFGILLDLSFNILLDPKSEAAHQAYSMHILYEMYKVEPQIKDELRDSIDAILEFTSSGVKNLGKKILRKLN